MSFLLKLCNLQHTNFSHIFRVVITGEKNQKKISGHRSHAGTLVGRRLASLQKDYIWDFARRDRNEY